MLSDYYNTQKVYQGYQSVINQSIKVYIKIKEKKSTQLAYHYHQIYMIENMKCPQGNKKRGGVTA